MKEGVLKGPKKSAFSVEYYQSEPELRFMEFLENENDVVKWTKNHGIRIPYQNLNGGIARYTPDFLIEYRDGTQELVELKGRHMINNTITQMKSKAAIEWCKKRGIKYTLKEV